MVVLSSIIKSKGHLCNLTKCCFSPLFLHTSIFCLYHSSPPYTILGKSFLSFHGFTFIHCDRTSNIHSIKAVDYGRSLLRGLVILCVIQKRTLVNQNHSLLDNALYVFVLYKHRGYQMILIEMKVKMPKLKFLKMNF